MSSSPRSGRSDRWPRRLPAPLRVAAALLALTAPAGAGDAAGTLEREAGPAGPRTARVAAGTAHTCVVDAAGGVRCWGHGMRGNLGDGAAVDRASPVAVLGLDGVVEVAAGEWFSCARRSDGTVWCWGLNDHGQLGNGGRDDSRVPTRVVGVSGAEQLAAGERMACARTADDVLCWGELGIASRSRAVPMGIARPRDLSVGAIHGCAITSEARLRCFGSNYSGQLGGATRGLVGPPLATPAAVAGVSAGGMQTCAWTDRGALYCWGSDDHGSFAPFRGAVEHRPVAATAFGPVAWARSGYGLTCALGHDRRLRCQGANQYGQLGRRVAPAATPAVVPVDGVVDLAIGARHLCAGLVDGSVRCWGANYWGELGDGTTVSRAEPRPVLGVPDGTSP